MKKILYFSLFLALLSPTLFAANIPKELSGSGEVLSVDPVYDRITIKHGPVKGLASYGETEFFVSSKDILKGVSTGDLIDFTLTDDKGDTRVSAISRTGHAPEKDDRLPVGQAVQDVLEATGEVAKTVTSPIAPAHEVMSGAVGATTDTTGAVLKDAKPEVKEKF